MLAKGLAERLEARHGGRIESPLYDYRRDPETMLLNPRGIADYSVALADVVARVIDAGNFPWSSAAIARSCSAARSPLDGAAVTGYCFWMDMPISISPRRSRTVRRHRWNLRSRRAAVLSSWPDPEGKRRLIKDEDVVAFGRRDAEVAEAHDSQLIEDTAITVVDFAEVRKRGAREAIHRVIEDLSLTRARRYLGAP